MTCMLGPDDHQPTLRRPRERGPGGFVEALESRQLMTGTVQNPDIVAPRVQSASITRDPGGLGFNIDVTYTDNCDLLDTSFNETDIRVTGPGNFDELGTVRAITDLGVGIRRVSYLVPSPTIFGTYSVDLEPLEVEDTSMNFANFGTIGTFQAGLQLGGGGGGGSQNPNFGRPDFAVAILRTPNRAATLGPGNVNLRVSNLGDVASPGRVPINIFVSADRTLDDDDTFVTSVSTNRIDGGESRRISVRLTFPDVPAGDYFLIARADPANEVREVSETNNNGVSLARVPIAVPFIDLSPEVLGTLPNQVVGGDPGRVTVEISNLGTSTFDRTATVNLYVSSNQTLDPSDRLVQTLPNTPLRIQAGGERRLRLNFAYPTNVPDANYFLIAQTDVGSSILDANAANNTDASETSVLIRAPFIDLRADGLSVTSGPLARRGNAARVSLSNLGNVGAEGPLTISLSAVGPTLPNGSAPLGNFQTALRVRNEGTQRVTFRFDLPTNLPAGTYFLQAALDPDQRFSERDESNNQVITVNPFPVPIP